MIDLATRPAGYSAHFLNNYSTIDYAKPIKPIFGRCCVRVEGPSGFQTYQCNRLDGYGPDQAFCPDHENQRAAGTLAPERYHP